MVNISLGAVNGMDALERIRLVRMHVTRHITQQPLQHIQALEVVDKSRILQLAFL